MDTRGDVPNIETSITALLDRVTQRAKVRYEERLKLVQDRRIRGGTEEWNVFNSGVQEHFAAKSNWTTFFNIGGFTEESIRAEMKQRRETLYASGKKLLIVEHFGQGKVGIELGADKVIITGLTKFTGAPPGLVEQVTGDALADEREKELEMNIRHALKEGHSLELVLFRPVGGLSVNSLNIYAFRRLYNQLRTAYELLSDDGLMFIGSVGTGLELELLQSMFDTMGCSNLLMAGSNKNALGIRKNSAIRATLPTETEWLMKSRDALQRLVALDEQDKNILSQPPKVRVPVKSGGDV